VRVKKDRKVSCRQYTAIEQTYIVYLRFDSLEDFTRVARSTYKIAAMLKLRPTTVNRIINRYIRNDYKVVDRRTLRTGVYLPPDVADELASTELLTQWAPYSLSLRVTMIEHKYGIKLSYSALRKFYRDNGITVRKPHTIPWRSFHQRPGLPAERRDFCVKLTTLIGMGESVCYVDQTSFNLWMGSQG
jgi:transposase